MQKIIRSGVLVDQVTLEKQINSNGSPWLIDKWMATAYADFSKVLSQNDFPCLFGRSANKRKTLKFLFVQETFDLVIGMLAYTAFIKATPLEERLFNPLIVIFQKTGFSNLTEEHTFCWEQLQALHWGDPSKWPKDIPTDPNDSQWTFCFDEVQLFFNMSCPHHEYLKSRNLGTHITFVVNPRQNFDAIASMNSAKGLSIRQSIRERVRQYNNGYVPSELGFFGDDNNLEWKQYQLNEPDSKFAKTCPFAVSHKLLEGNVS
ncbi:YqcI/YcgG family protein [Acinetobacter baumannii]|uniref:YqcI/YcgG family protein n=1 Tax=Acinetobacter baumannii TaxID=470 RepID=UPI003AF7918A